MLNIMQKHINKLSLTILTMLGIVKLSSKGQLVIPENIRSELGLVEGSTCILRTVDNKIILEKTDDVERKIAFLEQQKERLGWSKLMEKSLKKVWDNEEDENEWKKYL